LQVVGAQPADLDSTISSLVALLGASCAEVVQEVAAEALASLSLNSDDRVEIAAACAIPPLVALLGSSSVYVQREAAGALLGLAKGNSVNQAEIVVAGGVPALKNLICESAKECLSILEGPGYEAGQK
jgi:HEAT repeat protein